MRKTIITAALAVILLAGCAKQGKRVEIKDASEGTFVVEKLFEVDGVSVYRFRDSGERIYFTNRTGRVEYDHTHMVGKTVVTEREQTICNGDGQEDKH
jgi:hypothetical protein